MLEAKLFSSLSMNIIKMTICPSINKMVISLASPSILNLLGKLCLLKTLLNCMMLYHNDNQKCGQMHTR